MKARMDPGLPSPEEDAGSGITFIDGAIARRERL
jgi:hypothetical protein